MTSSETSPSLGTFSWFGNELPLSERLRLIRQSGFSQTFLWMGSEEPLVEAGRAEEMPGMAADAGLAVDHVHASYDNANAFWSDSPTERDALVDEYLKLIEYCSRHSISCIVLHVTKGPNPPPSRAEGVEIFRRLGEEAASSGIRLALENTRVTSRVDFILNELPLESLGLCYDSSHDTLYSDTPGVVLGKWAHRLFTTHFSDTDGRADVHWLPMKGIVDWDAVSSAYPTSHTGPVMIEAVPEDAVQPPAEFLADAYHKAVDLRERLLAGHE
ncbi:MAG: sugar phosphate isomerase/epimerase [Gemmatimonadota bacterium]|nr:sugar phosphate isomerase/epimerase [Gemmatimonadota bacterium]